MALQSTWTLESRLDAVAPVSEAVREFALSVLGEEGAQDLELAVVEAVTNVIKHGYGPEGGRIRVEADAEAEGVTIRILDQGRAIPPEALGGAGPGRFDFDPENLDGVPAGGMGLSLISMLMDEVSYDSRDGQNVLRLVRRVRA